MKQKFKASEFEIKLKTARFFCFFFDDSKKFKAKFDLKKKALSCFFLKIHVHAKNKKKIGQN